METLLENPATLQGDNAQQRNYLPQLPNINVLLLKLHLQLDADETVEREKAQRLPEKVWQLSKKAASLAVTAYLSSKAIHTPNVSRSEN